MTETEFEIRKINSRFSALEKQLQNTCDALNRFDKLMTTEEPFRRQLREAEKQITDLQEDVKDLDEELGRSNEMLDLTKNRVSALEKLLGEE